MSAAAKHRLSIALLCIAAALASAAQATDIQGRVCDTKGVPVAGVLVQFTGGLPMAVTDAQGRYSVPVPGGVGEFTITPWKLGYFFSPPTATVSVSVSSATANFAARSAQVLLAVPPTTVVITSPPPSPAPPLVVTYGAPVTVKWDVFVNGVKYKGSLSHNHVQWWTNTDPSVVFTTKHDTKAPFQMTFTAPWIDCIATIQVHAVVNGKNYYSTKRNITVGTGINSMPLIAITSCPPGADPGKTFKVQWQITGGKPASHNSVHWGLSVGTMTKSTSHDLTVDKFTPPNTFAYARTITAPKINGKIYIQVHATIGGEDYVSGMSEVNVPPADTTVPLVIQAPKGDPTSTDALIAGTSQKVFSSAAPGVLQVLCTFTVNAPGDWTGKVRAAIEPVGDSTLEWYQVDPVTKLPTTTSSWTAGNLGRPATAHTSMGLAVKTNGNYEVMAVFTNLPTSNSGFGWKKVFAQLVDGGIIKATVSAPIGVFYGREDTNNPTAMNETNRTTENWFHYWKAAGVVKKSSGWKFSPLTTVTGYFDPLGQLGPPDPANVYVTKYAAGINYGPERFFKMNGEYVDVTGDGAGPDCCAEILSHELMHKWFYDNFLLLISIDPTDPYGDPDDDQVPNFVEEWCVGLATDPTDPDTYNLGSVYAVYESIGDQEVRCRRKELIPDIDTNPALDWSWPWKQYSGIPTPGQPPPTISVVATFPNADELGPVDGLFTIRRTGSTASALRVNYTLPGTGASVATNGVDYETLIGSVWIPAGAATVTLPVRVLPRAGTGDGQVEGTEFVDLVLTPSVAGAYAVDVAASSARVNIKDADKATP